MPTATAAAASSAVLLDAYLGLARALETGRAIGTATVPTVVSAATGLASATEVVERGAPAGARVTMTMISLTTRFMWSTGSVRWLRRMAALRMVVMMEYLGFRVMFVLFLKS